MLRDKCGIIMFKILPLRSPINGKFGLTMARKKRNRFIIWSDVERGFKREKVKMQTYKSGASHLQMLSYLKKKKILLLSGYTKISCFNIC